MTIKYSTAQLLDMVNQEAQNMDTFYNAPCVNYSGTTNDPENEFYTEIISDYLLNNSVLFNKIQKLSRPNYNVGHNGTTSSPSSNRLEERIALALFGKYLPPIGKIIDYQVPLKTVQADDAGKLDLLAFDEATGVLRLIELKAPGSDETLLRSVLEIYTYYKNVDIVNLIKSYGLENKCTKVKICSLFFKDGKQNDEYNTLHQRPNLFALMHDMNGIDVELELLRFTFDDKIDTVGISVGDGTYKIDIVSKNGSGLNESPALIEILNY